MVNKKVPDFLYEELSYKIRGCAFRVYNTLLSAEISYQSAVICLQLVDKHLCLFDYRVFRWYCRGMKHTIQTNLQVSILKERSRYIAYAPALDFSTSGASYEEAKKRFDEGVQLFFEEIIKRGTLEEVLKEYGWRKMRFEWKPPMIVSQESREVKVPA